MKLTIPALLLCMATNQAIGQCVPPVTPPVIACGTGTPLADGVSINTGQTYQFNGTGGSFSNVTINGGTLVLCGSVTLTNTNFNSGTLLVNPGATVTFAGNYNAGSGRRNFNYGNIIFNGNVSVAGTNTLVFNAAGASITANGSIAVFNNGLFINNGTATANDVIINSGAQLCFGPNASAQAVNLVNNQTNAVTVPTGVACASYSGSFTGNNPITATSSLRICQQSSASAPQPVVIGSAIVTSNCASCPSLIGTLPLTLASFKGRQLNDHIELEWETVWEENVQAFFIEQSDNAQAYKTIGEVKAKNQPATYHFQVPTGKDGYFRLKMVDIDGRFTYSSIVKITTITSGLQVTVLSNPIRQPYADISIAVARNQTAELLLVDNMGRPVRRKSVSLTRGTNNIRLALDGVTTGQYYLSCQGKFDRSDTVQLIKL